MAHSITPPYLGFALDTFCNINYNFAKFHRISCNIDCKPKLPFGRQYILDFKEIAIHMTKANNPLIINVGFVVKAEAGFEREFEFDLPELFIPPETNLNNLLGKAKIGRTPQGLVAKIEMSAQTKGNCSRCLDSIEIRVATEFTELYAFDERSLTESHLLLPKNHQIDLAPLIREYLILDMPISTLCKADCKGLCSVCGVNHNHEDCEHPHSSTDTPFSNLQDLFNEED